MDLEKILPPDLASSYSGQSNGTYMDYLIKITRTLDTKKGIEKFKKDTEKYPQLYEILNSKILAKYQNGIAEKNYRLNRAISDLNIYKYLYNIDSKDKELLKTIFSKQNLPTDSFDYYLYFTNEGLLDRVENVRDWLNIEYMGVTKYKLELNMKIFIYNRDERCLREFIHLYPIIKGVNNELKGLPIKTFLKSLENHPQLEKVLGLLEKKSEIFTIEENILTFNLNVAKIKENNPRGIYFIEELHKQLAQLAQKNELFSNYIDPFEEINILIKMSPRNAITSVTKAYLLKDIKFKYNSLEQKEKIMTTMGEMLTVFYDKKFQENELVSWLFKWDLTQELSDKKSHRKNKI